MYQFQDIINWSYGGKGEFGLYFFNGNVGIKLLKKDARINKDEISYIKAEREYETLKKVPPHISISPKPIEVVTTYYKGLYYPAILMEHIDMLPLSHYFDITADFEDLTLWKQAPKYKRRNIFAYIEDLLHRHGIIYHDLHEDNILVEVEDSIILDFRVIDWQPSFVSFFEVHNVVS